VPRQSSPDEQAAALKYNCTGLPAGATCNFSPSSGTLPANGTLNSTLIVSLNASAAFGVYPVTISISTGGGTQTTVPLTIEVGGTSGIVSPTSATIPVGKSAQFNVALNSENGLTAPFTFSCPGVPAGVSCSFVPASGTLPANGTLSSTLTITVTSMPASASRHASSVAAYVPLGISLAVEFEGAIFVVVLFLGIGIRGSSLVNCRLVRVRCFAAAVLLFTAAALVSCGGGSGSQGPPPPPPTTVNVSIQAISGSITQSLGTITVQIPSP